MTSAAPTEVGVLLDEDLDVRLREPLAARLAPHGYSVRTVRDLGWLGIKNGPLLDGMAEVGLKVLVTADAHLYRQRSGVLRRLGIGLVIPAEHEGQQGDHRGATTRRTRRQMALSGSWYQQWTATVHLPLSSLARLAHGCRAAALARRA